MIFHPDTVRRVWVCKHLAQFVNAKGAGTNRILYVTNIHSWSPKRSPLDSVSPVKQNHIEFSHMTQIQKSLLKRFSMRVTICTKQGDKATGSFQLHRKSQSNKVYGFGSSASLRQGLYNRPLECIPLQVQGRKGPEYKWNQIKIALNRAPWCHFWPGYREATYFHQI